MKKILPDTNVYTSYLTGDHAVLDALAEAEIIYLSIFVPGELYAGFKGGNREIENHKILLVYLSMLIYFMPVYFFMTIDKLPGFFI